MRLIEKRKLDSTMISAFKVDIRRVYRPGGMISANWHYIAKEECRKINLEHRGGEITWKHH